MLVGFSALSMFSKNALLQLCSSVTLTDLVTDLVLDFSHDIQIRQTWFHHQHISSFFHISLLQHRTTVKISYSSCNKPPITQTYTHKHKSAHHSSNGESSGSGRQLITAPVPKRRFGLCSISAHTDTHTAWSFSLFSLQNSRFTDLRTGDRRAYLPERTVITRGKLCTVAQH